MDETLQIQSTRLPDGLIEAKLGNLTVRVRESDGWVDATHLSQSAGKLLGHWSRLQSASQTIEFFRRKVGGEVIDLQNGNRAFMHPKLAVQFAQWLSHDYAWTVSEVMEGYHRGDLAVAAQVVQNHDAINDTTSVVAIQSIGNSLLASDGLTVEQKRAKSIELTKDAHDKFARKGAKPTDFIDVHNAINQSAFNFDGPTHAFRETHGIPKGRTPRAYGQLEQQEAVVLMTMIAKGFFEQDEMSLRESKDKTIDRIKIIGGILKESGISTKPLLTQQITPDRSLVGGAISRPAITSSARMGIISNQGQIDAFFAPRSVSS